MQRSEARCFWIPLVPANAHANFAALRRPRLKPEVARRKIKFFVIQRIIRDVHLAIFAKNPSVRVDDCRGVVINAGAAPLEKRRDDHGARFTRHFAQCRRGFPRHFLGQIEIFVIFALAKILRPKQLRQTDHLRALLCGIANEFNRAREILLRLRAAAHLDQSNLCHVARSRDISHHFNSERFLDFARNDKTDGYFTESARTISIFSITTRFVGLLISPCAFRSTGVSPIFSNTSSPLINLPKVVY